MIPTCFRTGSITRRDVVYEARHDVEIVRGERAFIVDRRTTVPGGAERVEWLQRVFKVGFTAHGFCLPTSAPTATTAAMITQPSQVRGDQPMPLPFDVNHVLGLFI
jgi:hypothetical protein